MDATSLGWDIRPDPTALFGEVDPGVFKCGSHGLDRSVGDRLAQLEPGARHATYCRLPREIMQGPLQGSASHS